MMPLWLAIPALVVATAVGTAIERAALGARPLLDRDPSTWLVRVVVGLAVYVALVVHPVLGVALVVSFVVVGRRLRREGLPPIAVPPTPFVALALALVALVVVAARPAVPIGWDEAVWLARARVACDGPWALAARALDPHDELVPAGYPLGASALHAAFALFDPDLGPLTSGAASLTLLSVVVLALVVAATPDVSRGAAALVVVAAPLLWAHLRSGTLDLPIGALAAAFALSLLGAARKGGRDALLAPALACLLASTKDEGVLHAVVIAGALSAFAPERARLRRHAALAAVVALATFGTWRLRIALAGAPIEHHTVAGFALGALPALSRELVRAAADVGSFGASIAVITAATLASIVRRGAHVSRALALAVVGILVGSLVALMLGPDAVRDFALEGTVFPRLLVQLVPIGALVVGAAMRERDGSEVEAVATTAGATTTTDGVTGTSLPSAPEATEVV